MEKSEDGFRKVIDELRTTLIERDDYRERLQEAQEQSTKRYRTIERLRADLATANSHLSRQAAELGAVRIKGLKPHTLMDRARLPRLDGDYVDTLNVAMQSIVPSNSEQLRQLAVRVGKLEQFKRDFDELQRHAAAVVRAVREELSELGIQVRQLGHFSNRVEHYARRIWEMR